MHISLDFLYEHPFLVAQALYELQLQPRWLNVVCARCEEEVKRE